jgi:hypothetical protein
MPTLRTLVEMNVDKYYSEDYLSIKGAFGRVVAAAVPALAAAVLVEQIL